MVDSLYPVLLTDNIETFRHFFTSYFSFAEVFAADWYVSLKKGEQEIAFIDSRHETIPEEHRRQTSGLIINIEVDNAAAIYETLRQQTDYPLLLPLRDEAFGQRHFILEVQGIMIDIIEETEPSPAFKEHYSHE